MHGRTYRYEHTKEFHAHTLTRRWRESRKRSKYLLLFPWFTTQLILKYRLSGNIELRYTRSSIVENHRHFLSLLHNVLSSTSLTIAFISDMFRTIRPRTTNTNTKLRFIIENIVYCLSLFLSCTRGKNGIYFFYLILFSVLGHNSFIIFTNPSARAGYDTRSIFLSGF